jgi:hypothetical protein
VDAKHLIVEQPIAVFKFLTQTVISWKVPWSCLHVVILSVISLVHYCSLNVLKIKVGLSSESSEFDSLVGCWSDPFSVDCKGKPEEVCRVDV